MNKISQKQKEKEFIELYEFVCTNCDKFFLSEIEKETLICPYCSRMSYFNDEVKIKLLSDILDV